MTKVEQSELLTRYESKMQSAKAVFDMVIYHRAAKAECVPGSRHFDFHDAAYAKYSWQHNNLVEELIKIETALVNRHLFAK